jgi:RNA polymerase sigma factor (sigma-70 family)
MATAKSIGESQALQIVRELAEKRFSRRWNCDDLVADAVSLAWEAFRDNPEVPLSGFTWYAIHRAKCGKQFRQSTRSIDGPTDHWRQASKPDRLPVFKPDDFGRPGEDPALIAALRIDFAAWFDGFSPRMQAIVEVLILGESTQATAAQFGVTPGRISQLRRELVEDWLALE